MCCPSLRKSRVFGVYSHQIIVSSRDRKPAPYSPLPVPERPTDQGSPTSLGTEKGRGSAEGILSEDGDLKLAQRTSQYVNLSQTSKRVICFVSLIFIHHTSWNPLSLVSELLALIKWGLS